MTTITAAAKTTTTRTTTAVTTKNQPTNQPTNKEIKQPNKNHTPVAYGLEVREKAIGRVDRRGGEGRGCGTGWGAWAKWGGGGEGGGGERVQYLESGGKRAGRPQQCGCDQSGTSGSAAT